MVVDYSQGKIYKMVSAETDKIYIGSTALPRLCTRMAQHRSDFHRYQLGKRGYVASFELLQGIPPQLDLYIGCS